MSRVRIGRPTFLRSSARSLAIGAAAGLPLAAVVAAAGFPEWGQVVLDVLLIGVAIYAVGLLTRLVLHGVYELMFGGRTSTVVSRAALVDGTRYLLDLPAACVGAGLVLSLAFLAGTGDAGLPF